MAGGNRSWDPVILTIYIPTYKRPDIEPCLRSIVPQLVEGVEVIVSDNDPKGFAKPLVEKFPQVKYTRRLKNIEGDPNILRGVTQGTGKYVWIFGDDDTILPGTINALLPMLDGVDRVLHYTANSREVNPGFTGTISEYVASLTDKSVLTASTLITASVWRREAMDIGAGLDRLDTMYPLAWASLKMRTIKVMPHPTITVGHEYEGNGCPFFGKSIDLYLRSLSQYHGMPTLTFEQAAQWNFVSVSR